MEPNKDFTLIIHGPLTMYTVFTLYRYKEIFPIIIVIPRLQELGENTILKEVHNLMQTKGNRISLFIYDIPEKTNVINDQNRYYHFFSVHLGLQACTTKYSIKLRSDEFYSDLEPIVEAVKGNSGKLITTDVFFRNTKLPYHPSDHIVAGNTEAMLETFATAKLLCENAEVPNYKSLMKYTTETNMKSFDKEKNWLAAEQHLGLGAVLSQISPSKLKEPNQVQIMKELFHIVPTKELGLFRVMFNSAKDGPAEYLNDKFFNPESDINDIEDYN